MGPWIRILWPDYCLFFISHHIWFPTCQIHIRYSCSTCHLKYVYRLEENVSRAQGQNSQLPGETKTWTFDSHVIRSCFLKPWQIYEPAGVKQTISSQFFSGFELGGMTKHLMTGPAGNSEFCFPWGQSLRPVLIDSWTEEDKLRSIHRGRK